MKNFFKNTYPYEQFAKIMTLFLFAFTIGAIAYLSCMTITDTVHQTATIITPRQAISMTSAKDRQELNLLENYLVSAVNASIKHNYYGKSFNVKVMYQGYFSVNVMPKACKNRGIFTHYCYVNFSNNIKHEAAHMLITELKASGWYVNKNPIIGRNYLYMRVSPKPMERSIIIFTGR